VRPDGGYATSSRRRRDEWFNTFDVRKLNFLYQEERRDGNRSNFFRLESPYREDA
jgi:hypothetical protein